MTNRRIAATIAPLIVAATVVAGGTATASAQTGSSSSKKVEKLEPPTPGQAKTDGIVMPMLLGMVLAGAALVVNLIPSKRGHQD